MRLRQHRPTTTAASTSTRASRTTPSTCSRSPGRPRLGEGRDDLVHDPLRSTLSSTAQFQDFANLTVDNAGRLFGDVEQQATVAPGRRSGSSSPSRNRRSPGTGFSTTAGVRPRRTRRSASPSTPTGRSRWGGGQVAAAGRHAASELRHRPGQVRGDGRRQHRLRRHVDVPRARRLLVPVEAGDGRLDAEVLRGRAGTFDAAGTGARSVRPPRVASESSRGSSN